MPRLRTGQTRFRDGRWYARVTLEGDDRPSFELSTVHGEEHEAAARERAELLACLADKLRKAKALDLAPAILTKAASRDGRELAEVVRVVDQVCAGELVRATTLSLTVARLGQMWTSGELHKLHPDHVKRKRSAPDDKSRLETYV